MAERNGTCSNFGCKNKVVPTVNASIRGFECGNPSISGTIMHAFQSGYCSEKCSTEARKKD